MAFPSDLRIASAATATSLPAGAHARALGEVSALYEGWVTHRRLRPRAHRFQYRVFAMLLDLEELAALDRSLLLFAYNRWGLFSFQDRDHGDGRPLHTWLDGLLEQKGIVAKGRRRVLCYPRILGYVFNPLSVWFCDDEAGRLKAIIYEVHNTYAERHSYVLPVPQAPAPSTDVRKFQQVRHDCAKAFYVSPFLSRDCRYGFRIRPPGENVAIVIREDEAGAAVLDASFAGKCRHLDDRALAVMLFRYPLMTLKVIAAIHFEAVRLMLKGVRRHPHAPVRHSREAANRSSGVGSDPAMPDKAVQWTVLSDERPEHERRA